MKNFTRILSFVLTLVLAVSSLAVSVSAAVFSDYYETPEYFFGDTDFDGKITIKDATALQKHIAKIITLSEDALYYGDVNGSDSITISDATTIQKYVAKMIEIFPVEDNLSYYEYTVGEEGITVELDAGGGAEITVTVGENGFYNLSAVASQGSELYFDLSNDDDFWVSENDGEATYIYTYLKAGVYYAYMYTMGEENVVAEFKGEATNEELPFDYDDAKELKTGDRVEVKAGTTPLVFKVNPFDLDVAGDMYCLYTEGEDPKASMVCYDAKYYNCGTSELGADGKNAELYVYSGYAETDPYSYIVLTQEEGGSDFTLCCETSSSMIKNTAVEISLNAAQTIFAQQYEEVYEDESQLIFAGEGNYKFVPETSGYYSFNYKATAEIMIMSAVTLLDYMDNAMGYIDYSEEGELKNVEYLEEGEEYYIISAVFLNEIGSVEFTLKESSMEEYYQVHEGDYSDATPDEPELDEIHIGESVSVSFEATADEAFNNTKIFSFTAEEDCTVVLYSENSKDAFVDILDTDGWILHYSDDIEIAQSMDFAVIGTMEKGETVYFGVGTFSEDGDSYTLKLVAEENYTPII